MPFTKPEVVRAWMPDPLTNVRVYIWDKITGAAFKGRYSTWILGAMPTQIRLELEEAGYKVKTNALYTTISWSKQ